MGWPPFAELEQRSWWVPAAAAAERLKPRALPIDSPKYWQRELRARCGPGIGR